MVRILFFFMGVPMVVMSFFEAIDALPFVAKIDLISDGHVLELSQDQQETLRKQVEKLFENSLTMPAYGVVRDQDYREEIKNGDYISLKFNQMMEVNELPFDELVFDVQSDFQGFNLMRGINGVFEGRCIYISLIDKDMSELVNTIQQIKNPSLVENVDNSNAVESEGVKFDLKIDNKVDGKVE